MPKDLFIRRPGGFQQEWIKRPSGRSKELGGLRVGRKSACAGEMFRHRSSAIHSRSTEAQNTLCMANTNSMHSSCRLPRRNTCRWRSGGTRRLSNVRMDDMRETADVTAATPHAPSQLGIRANRVQHFLRDSISNRNHNRRHHCIALCAACRSLCSNASVKLSSSWVVIPSARPSSRHVATAPSTSLRITSARSFGIRK